MTIWVETTRLQNSDFEDGDRFGEHVAIDQDLIVVGALGHNHSNGAAYIFQKINGVWVQIQKLERPSSIQFGTKVSMKNGNIVILERSSRVTIFQKSDTSWVTSQIIDTHALCLAQNNDTLVIGSGSPTALTIYTLSDKTWILDQTLQAADIVPSSDLDFATSFTSIAIHNNTIVVGNPKAEGYLGQAYILEKNSDWQKVAVLHPSTSDLGQQFGFSVAVEDDIVVVGSLLGTGFNSGSADIFQKINDTWSFVQRLTDPTGNPAGEFGVVAIHNKVIAVGAKNKGQVFLFERSNGMWLHTNSLLNDPVYRFGTDIAMTPNTIVVAAPFDTINTGGINRGHVHVFEAPKKFITNINIPQALSDHASDCDFIIPASNLTPLLFSTSFKKAFNFRLNIETTDITSSNKLLTIRYLHNGNDFYPPYTSNVFPSNIPILINPVDSIYQNAPFNFELSITIEADGFAETKIVRVCVVGPFVIDDIHIPGAISDSVNGCDFVIPDTVLTQNYVVSDGKVIELRHFTFQFQVNSPVPDASVSVVMFQNSPDKSFYQQNNLFYIPNILLDNIAFDAPFFITITVTANAGRFSWNWTKNLTICTKPPYASAAISNDEQTEIVLQQGQCEEIPKVTNVNFLHQPLLSVALNQAEIEFIGSIGCDPLDTPSIPNTGYVCRLIDCATSLEDCLTHLYGSDIWDHISDTCVITYTGPIRANSVRVNLDRCTITFQNFEIPCPIE